MQVVSGYVCFNCTDVERAKKGSDPAVAAANPQAATDPKATELRRGQRVAEPNRPEEPRDQNRPLGFGNRGKVLNLLA